MSSSTVCELFLVCQSVALHQKPCQGSSLCAALQELSYSTTAGDEVEDLFLLLAYIKVRLLCYRNFCRTASEKYLEQSTYHMRTMSS
jgi:hypothetical protein